MHIKGFLNALAKPHKTKPSFKSNGKLGIPLVGVSQPSYRDDTKKHYKEKQGDFHVLTTYEWLKQITNKVTREVKNISKTAALSIGIIPALYRSARTVKMAKHRRFGQQQCRKDRMLRYGYYLDIKCKIKK